MQGAVFVQLKQPGTFQRQDVADYPSSLTNEIIDLNGDDRADFLGTGVTFGNQNGLAIETRLTGPDGSLGAAAYQELPYVRVENGLTWSNDPALFRIASVNGQEYVDLGYHDSQLADIDHDGKPEFIGYRMGFEMHYVNGVLSENGALSHLQIDILDITPDGKLVQKPITFDGWDYNAFFFYFQLIDLNRDGHLDFFIQNINSSGRPAVFLNDGALHFTRLPDDFLPAVSAASGITAYTSMAGDFNHDGLTDILIRAESIAGSIPIDTSLMSVHLATTPIYTGPNYDNPAQAPGFNESYYLHEYPDVAAAVAGGEYASGFAHYLSVGKAAGLYAFASGTWVYGTSAFDTITLREGDERGFGLDGDDVLDGGAGNDTLDGGTGVDTAIYHGNRADYSLSGPVPDFTVTGPDGSDTLSNVERLQFSDKKIAVDLSAGEAAGNTVRIIGAAFDAPAIQQHPDWVGIGLDLFDSGMRMQAVSDLVVHIMGLSNTDFVTTVYANVVGSAPSMEVRSKSV